MVISQLFQTLSDKYLGITAQDHENREMLNKRTGLKWEICAPRGRGIWEEYCSSYKTQMLNARDALSLQKTLVYSYDDEDPNLQLLPRIGTLKGSSFSIHADEMEKLSLALDDSPAKFMARLYKQIVEDKNLANAKLAQPAL